MLNLEKRSFFCDICLMIQSSAYGIVDISGLNPNVLLELGMMVSLGKPVFVLVKRSEQESLRKQLSSDIVWKRVILYEEFIDIQEKLLEPIQNRPPIVLMPSYREEFSEDPEHALYMGNFHYNRKEYDEALEFYDWTIALKPSYFEAWYNKGFALDELGKYEEAITCYDKALEIREDDVKYLRSKGATLSKLGKKEEAVKCYDKAEKIKEEGVRGFRTRLF